MPPSNRSTASRTSFAPERPETGQNAPTDESVALVHRGARIALTPAIVEISVFGRLRSI
jgi:hypothetical protein